MDSVSKKSGPYFHDGSTSTENSWFQGHDLYLVKPVRCSVLSHRTDWKITGDCYRKQFKNGWNRTKATKKWLCSMTILDSMLRKGSKTTWQCWLSLVLINRALPRWSPLPVLWKSKNWIDSLIGSKIMIFLIKNLYASLKMEENHGH